MNQVIKNEISGWDAWNARNYLDIYYATPVADTFVSLDFISDELKAFRDKPFETALEFGCGPTLFGALATAPFVKTLHLVDYLPRNLNEITEWLSRGPNAFNWDPCTSYILQKEGIEPTAENIAKKSDDLRTKVTTLLPGDITKSWPLLERLEKYDLLVSLYCADSITSSKEEWRQYMKNLFSIAKPKGTIIIGALRNCPFYRVGDQNFPCANVNEKDLEDIIKDSGLDIESYTVRVNETEDCLDEGFVSVMFARITLK